MSMNNLLICSATWVLVGGYIIHSLNYAKEGNFNLSVAMLLFAAAMFFLFFK